jgi:dTDP-4-dehydrorhamnose reductase
VVYGQQLVVETAQGGLRMNIAITGSSGMLGAALVDTFSRNNAFAVTGFDTKEAGKGLRKPRKFIKCDITDFEKFTAAVRSASPDTIIHAAAYTDVDGCELDTEKAETINGLGTRNVAEAARESKASLVAISTDFIFDGEKKSPYTEADIPNPLNVYGRTKLDSEKFVKEVMGADYLIVRTSWLFGRGGKNFVDTIIKKAKTEKEIRVVSDQFGSPTYVRDLAAAIKRLIGAYSRDKGLFGVYNITNSDDCSWYRLAERSLEISGIFDCDLIPIVSLELDRPADRPVMSILDNTKYNTLTGAPLQRWGKALEDHILSGKS